MNKTFLILGMLCATPAVGNLPTVGYVSEYYYRNCGNADLVVPGAGRTELSGERYVLDIIDVIHNGNTTYGPDAESDNIVSLGWLTETLDKLKDAHGCCLGGYYDAATDDCWTCGEWLMFSDTCPKVPSGRRFQYVARQLANTIMINSDEECPDGMVEYYEINDMCDAHIQ